MSEDVGARFDRLESLVERQQATIERQAAVIRDLRETVEAQQNTVETRRGRFGRFGGGRLRRDHPKRAATDWDESVHTTGVGTNGGTFDPDDYPALRALDRESQLEARS